MSGMALYQADTGRGDRSMMIFDPATEEVFVTLLADPTRDTGSAMGYWFQKLHLTHSFGLAYEIFVAILGVVITMFSVTGVYLWWTKRRVRRQKRRAQKRSAVTSPGEGEIAVRCTGTAFRG